MALLLLRLWDGALFSPFMCRSTIWVSRQAEGRMEGQREGNAGREATGPTLLRYPTVFWICACPRWVSALIFDWLKPLHRRTYCTYSTDMQQSTVLHHRNKMTGIILLLQPLHTFSTHTQRPVSLGLLSTIYQSIWDGFFSNLKKGERWLISLSKNHSRSLLNILFISSLMYLFGGFKQYFTLAQPS